MYTAIALVGAGVGVAILPQSVVLAQSRKVVIHPLPYSVGASEIAIATARNSRSTLVDSFVSLAGTFRKRQFSTRDEN
jgi:DNA-binding transcriptional LysR family regulator